MPLMKLRRGRMILRSDIYRKDMLSRFKDMSEGIGRLLHMAYEIQESKISSKRKKELQTSIGNIVNKILDNYELSMFAAKL